MILPDLCGTAYHYIHDNNHKVYIPVDVNTRCTNMNENKYRYVSIVFALMLVTSLGLAFAGMGAAQESIEDGDRYWMGQTLEYEVGEDASNAEVVTEDEGTLVTELSIVDGMVTIDTEDNDDFDDGKYVLNYVDSDNNDSSVEFELTTQNLSVDAEDGSVANDGSESDTTFELDSNRADYDVNVSVDDLSDSEFAELFTDESFDEDDVEDGNLTFTSVSSSIPVDFDGVDAGEYEFTFDVVDSEAEDTTSLTVYEPGDANVVLTDSSLSVAQGDYVDMTLEFEEADTAEVIIGDEDDVGYELNFTVEDTEDNGEVTVRFDSYLAGQGNADVVSVHDDSEGDVVIEDETELSEDRRLAVETYDMTVSPQGQDETDIGSLNVIERTSTGVTSQALPGDSDVSELDDVNNASDTDTVAEDDYMVFAVEMTGIYSFLDEDYDFSNNNDGLEAELVEVSSSPNSNDRVIDEDMEHVDIYPDSSEGVFYVVYDTSDESFEFEFGEEYEFTVTLTEENDYVEDEDAEEVLETNLTLEERDTEFVGFNDDDVIEYSSSSEETVVAETNVAENTERTLVVRTSGDDPSISDYDISVENGEFVTDVDMSGLDVGSEFTIQIRAETDEEDAIIVESTDDGVDDDDDGTDDDDGATDDGTDEGTDDDDSDVTDDSTPGFGLVVAFVALLIAVALAVRRNEE